MIFLELPSFPLPLFLLFTFLQALTLLESSDEVLGEALSLHGYLPPPKTPCPMSHPSILPVSENMLAS